MSPNVNDASEYGKSRGESWAAYIDKQYSRDYDPKARQLIPLLKIQKYAWDDGGEFGIKDAKTLNEYYHNNTSADYKGRYVYSAFQAYIRTLKEINEYNLFFICGYIYNFNKELFTGGYSAAPVNQDNSGKFNNINTISQNFSNKINEHNSVDYEELERLKTENARLNRQLVKANSDYAQLQGEVKEKDNTIGNYEHAQRSDQRAPAPRQDRDQGASRMQAEFDRQLQTKDTLINGLNVQIAGLNARIEALGRELADARAGQGRQDQRNQQDSWRQSHTEQPAYQEPAPAKSMGQESRAGEQHASNEGCGPLCAAITRASSLRKRDEWESNLNGYDFSYAFIQKGDGSPFILSKGDKTSLFVAVDIGRSRAAILPSFSASNLTSADIRKLYDIEGVPGGGGYMLSRPAVASIVGDQYSVVSADRGVIQFR